MTHNLVEEVLQTWRDGERLLEELPALSNDHETVRLAVASMHATYSRLTSTSSVSHEVLVENRVAMRRAREIIDGVRGGRVSTDTGHRSERPADGSWARFEGPGKQQNRRWHQITRDPTGRLVTYCSRFVGRGSELFDDPGAGPTCAICSRSAARRSRAS